MKNLPQQPVTSVLLIRLVKVASGLFTTQNWEERSVTICTLYCCQKFSNASEILWDWISRLNFLEIGEWLACLTEFVPCLGRYYWWMGSKKISMEILIDFWTRKLGISANKYILLCNSTEISSLTRILKIRIA